MREGTDLCNVPRSSSFSRGIISITRSYAQGGALTLRSRLYIERLGHPGVTVMTQSVAFGVSLQLFFTAGYRRNERRPILAIGTRRVSKAGAAGNYQLVKFHSQVLTMNEKRSMISTADTAEA